MRTSGAPRAGGDGGYCIVYVTAILWIDSRQLNLSDEQLKWGMVDVAIIAPSMGCSFGPGGSSFIRLNLGCPRTYLEKALEGLKRI